MTITACSSTYVNKLYDNPDTNGTLKMYRAGNNTAHISNWGF